MQPLPPEKQNVRDGGGHADALRIFEATYNFEDTEISQIVKAKRLQRQFGFAFETAVTIARLAYAVGR